MFFDSSSRHSPAAAASSVGDPDADGGLQHLDSEICYYWHFSLYLKIFLQMHNPLQTGNFDMAWEQD